MTLASGTGRIVPYFLLAVLGFHPQRPAPVSLWASICLAVLSVSTSARLT